MSYNVHDSNGVERTLVEGSDLDEVKGNIKRLSEKLPFVDCIQGAYTNTLKQLQLYHAWSVYFVPVFKNATYLIEGVYMHDMVSICYWNRDRNAIVSIATNQNRNTLTITTPDDETIGFIGINIHRDLQLNPSVRRVF